MHTSDRAATMSSSWAGVLPDQPPPCCSLVSGVTWWSWIRHHSPSDTVSTHWIARSGVVQLSAARVCSMQ